MAFDTPAQIAVIGAGPMGLETALYARFLGYSVDILEQGAICQHVHKWGHVPLFTPFSMNASPLGIAALKAQDENYQPPKADEIHTGSDWIERYLLPLAQSDLLADSIHEQCKVIAVSRDGKRKTDAAIGDRAETRFRILTEMAGGIRDERIYEADIVIDTSGVLSQPNWLGSGGVPAIGERQCRMINNALPSAERFLEHGIPNASENGLTGKSILVVGGGYSAATSIAHLANIAESNPNTKITWAISRNTAKGPITQFDNDPLAQRAQLSEQANAIACSAVDSQSFNLLVDHPILSLIFDAQTKQCTVEFQNKVAPSNWKEKPQNIVKQFDKIIANIGYQPDNSIFRELQIQQCQATEGPMKLAAERSQTNAAQSPHAVDCLTATTEGRSLVTTEPNFYILGSKSFGRDPNFLFSNGLQQIKELFSLIGDRATLDLYATQQIA